MKLEYKSIENVGFYTVNHPRAFVGMPILKEDIQSAIDFSYEMCFGQGHHRDCRTGGQYGRKSGEKFCNTFQGKLAEVVLYHFFKLQGLDSKAPDFGVFGKGIWDDCDLEIKGKKINVKSVASQSNLLLLETKDWNEKGQYIPNLLANNGTTISYDYFILVRIQPDIKKLFSAQRYLYSNEIEKKDIEDLIYKSNWNFDIAGYCSHEQFIAVIKNGNILPQNAMLNQYTKMDASNYYVQSGDLNVINDLVQELKQINII